MSRNKKLITGALVAVLVLGGASVSRAQGTYQPTTPPGQAEIIELLRRAFPNLGTDFQIMGPVTKQYNAFGHVIGDHSRWIIAGTFADADAMLRQSRYVRLPHFDVRLEAGKEKAVVFATLKPDGTIDKIQSASLQEADGTWSTKVGALPLIRHRSLEQLRSLTYGAPVYVYVRDRRQAPQPPATAFDPAVIQGINP